MKLWLRALPIVLLAVALSAGDCGPPPCVATTCLEGGRVCGTMPDGCGLELQCGTCNGGLECNPFGECEKPCIPTTCEALGKNCGRPSDGCRSYLRCGSCGGDDLCGGAGEDFTCGMPPDACAAGAWSGYAQRFFQNNCVGCHSEYRTLAGAKKEAKLREQIATDEMPRGKTLTANEKAWILRWIDCGQKE